MPYRDREIEKRYHSISEVADLFEVNASLIRFWEKEFPEINPKKDRKGARRYTAEDIALIRVVHHLVKRRGFTLEGARKHLKQHGEEAAQREAEVADRLERIKAFLLELKAQL